MAGEVFYNHQLDEAEHEKARTQQYGAPAQTEWLCNQALQSVLQERQEELARINKELYGNKVYSKYDTTPIK